MVLLRTFCLGLILAMSFVVSNVHAQTANAAPSARAYFEQGKAAHDGINMAKDYQAARYFYLKAANMGSNEALINLGYLYFTGQGVERNFETARSFYEKAAMNGDRDARRNIAMMDKAGLGLPPKAAAKPKLEPKVKPAVKAVKPKVKLDPKPAIETIKARETLATAKAEPTPPAAVKIDKPVPAPEAKAKEPKITLPSTAVKPLAVSIPVIAPKSLQQPGTDIPNISNAKSNVLVPNKQVTPDTSTALNETPVARQKNTDNGRLVAMCLVALITLMIYVAIHRLMAAETRAKKAFIDDFYDRKRGDLRLTYLRRRTHNLDDYNFYSRWQSTLSVLMARYALFYNQDPFVKKFCYRLNKDFINGKRPTHQLAREFSDSLLERTVWEVKAVDAFQTARISEPLSPVKPMAKVAMPASIGRPVSPPKRPLNSLYKKNKTERAFSS